MPEFRTEGFQRVAAELGADVVGEPIEEEQGIGGGSQVAVVQATTRGLMWYSPAGNLTLFLPAARLPADVSQVEEIADLPVVDVVDLVGDLPVDPEARLELREPSEISLLVVHWKGSSTPYPDGYDPRELYRREAEEHIRRDWDAEQPGSQGGYGLMYHESISRDGRVWITRPAEHVVWACRGANRRAYNLVVDAGPGWEATEAQRNALLARLAALRARFRLERRAVSGHGELVADGNRTECPGEAVLGWVRQYREGAES